MGERIEQNDVEKRNENTSECGGVVRGEKAVNDVRAATKSNISRWFFIVALSLGIHEPVYHNQLKSLANEYVVEPYRSVREAMKKQQTEDRMKSEYKDALDGDRKNIGERNKDRIERIKARAEAAKAFREKIYGEFQTMPYNNVFFDIEYFDQGMSDDELAVAKPYFGIVADRTEVTPDEPPTKDKLKKIVEVFMPPGSYDRTKTSAVDSLVHQLGPKSQNCVARTRLMIMAIATKYPSLQKNLFIQKFGDHERALVEIEGTRYILEGAVESFPDEDSNRKKNEVMPFEVWLGLYAGYKRSEFEGRIEKFGPQSPDREKPRDYARATDNLVADNFWDKDLDNVGNAEGWFADGTEEGDHAGNIEAGDAGIPGEFNGHNVVDGGDFDGGNSTSLLEREEDTLNLSSPNVENLQTEYYLDYPVITKDDVYKIAKEENASKIRTIRVRMAEKIDAETAQAFLDLKDEKHGMIALNAIEFLKLKDIDEETAKIIGQFSGHLNFHGFTVVPVSLMKGLSGGNAYVHIKAPIVSTEALKAFVGEAYGSKLTDFFNIEDLLPEDANSNFDVSREMAGSNEPYRMYNMLSLEGLTGLSNESAAVLGRYGGAVQLIGIPLTRENVERMDLSRAKFLNLRDIPPAALKGFANATGGTLNLSYSRGEFTVEAAEALYGFQGDLSIFADSMGVEAAEYLGRRESENLLKVVLFDMNEEVFLKLSGAKGHLHIDYKQKIVLSEKLSEAFSRHEGILSFSGEMYIDSKGVHHWKNFKGDRLDLGEVVNPNPEVLRGLADYKGELSIKSKFDEISVAQARALSGHKGALTVSAKTITPEAFRYLLQVEGPLDLHGIEKLTYEMAVLLRARLSNPIYSGFSVRMPSVRVIGKRAAVILHNLNGGELELYDTKTIKVMIDDIAMMKVNAPFRPEIKWDEE